MPPERVKESCAISKTVSLQPNDMCEFARCAKPLAFQTRRMRLSRKVVRMDVVTVHNGLHLLLMPWVFSAELLVVGSAARSLLE